MKDDKLFQIFIVLKKIQNRNFDKVWKKQFKIMKIKKKNFSQKTIILNNNHYYNNPIESEK